MKKASPKSYVLATSVLCALAMCFVDGVIQPPYGVKSALKIVLFLLVPLAYFARFHEWERLKALFVPKKRDLVIAICLGIGAFGFLLGGYWVLNRFLDLTDTILQLTADGGVNPENFGWISMYIALVNSLLEEFFFRGFAFLSLKRLTNRCFAYLFSAAAFAVYHFGMFAGDRNLLIWFLAMAGLVIAGMVLNFLNEKSGNIITSWLFHMFANLSINTIGFYVFGML